MNDYHLIAQVGILAADARVELIEGEAIDMSPVGSVHGSVVDRLSRRDGDPNGGGRCAYSRIRVHLVDGFNEAAAIRCG